jgi:oxygen-independent coproporphyrinogen-3 oxidase
MVTFLEESGYKQYETSNFARSAEFQSRHNLKYWTFAPYLGLGPAAHSFFEPRRSWNQPGLEAYIEELENGRLPVAGSEVLNSEALMTEAVYLGLRMKNGIDVEGFERRFGVSFQGLFGAKTARFERRGWLQTRGGRCRLTLSGMLLLDRIAAELVACLPEAAPASKV